MKEYLWKGKCLVLINTSLSSCFCLKMWKLLPLNVKKSCQTLSHSLLKAFIEHFAWNSTYKNVFSVYYVFTIYWPTLKTFQMSSFKMNASLLMPNLDHFEITIIMDLLYRKSVQVFISLLDINNNYNYSSYRVYNLSI